MSNLKHWIWLTRRKGIAGQATVQILEHFGSPEQVHAADRVAYETMGGLSDSAIRSLLDKSLDGVQDPGNVGTIWRAADAFGADGLILCSGCADPWSPKTVRSTMGAVFRLPVYEGTLRDAAERLAAACIPLYAAALRENTEDIRDVPLDQAAVIIGSEGRGVSDEALALCQKTVRIPMRARCESLNAAVAASVVLWEMARGEL